MLKKLKAYKPKSLKREIQILTSLRNTSSHIVTLLEAIKDVENKTATLVYSHVKSISFAKMTTDLSEEDIKFYLYQLLLAIGESHSRGIMHRDIKLTNVIVSLE